jgi:hypothetical protein
VAYIARYIAFRNLDATGSRFRISGTHFENDFSPGRPAVRGFISGVIGTNPATAQTNRTSLPAGLR